MTDKYGLIEKNLIPLSKYWSMRLGFLDMLNGTKLFIPQIEGRNDLGDDLKIMISISKEWKEKKEHNVGEAGALFRLLQFTSWKFGLNKTFIKEKTLKDRDICDDPKIVNWPITKLLELDNRTPQWASAAILTGSEEKSPDNYFLNLSREALVHYQKCQNENRLGEPRFDDTILNQAEAFLEILNKGQTTFKPKQQDDYPFSRAFGLIGQEEAEKLWPELRGHESDRLAEMETEIANLEKGRKINSRDHRVVQAIAMLALSRAKNAAFANLRCVSKSWPQFWKFLEYAKLKNKNNNTMNDQIIKSTGCCEPFNPAPWQDQEITWQDKLFVTDHVTSILYIPLNFGAKMTKNSELIDKAGAKKPTIVISGEESLWGSNIYIDVDQNIPGAKMTTISGTFLTKVFEGPYQNMGKWIKEMDTYVKSKGKETKKLYSYYTTCPKCAKAYGKNYVVLLAKIN